MILGADIARRGALIARFDRPHFAGYWASVVASAVFWAVLLFPASRRRGLVRHVSAGLFIALYTIAVGTQSAFHALFHFYLSADAQTAPASLVAAVTGAVPLERPAVALSFLAALGAAVAFVGIARRFARPHPARARLSPLLTPAALYAMITIPVSYYRIQSSPPDLIYAHALRFGVQERLGVQDAWPGLLVQRRSPEPVPPLSPSRRADAPPRNVVLLLQEAQRADVTCIEYDPGCLKATPASNIEAPRRLPLLQMRANSSATAVSLSNLWSGVSPAAPRDVLLSTPLLWELAKAAGLHTAYWTSQHLSFGNARLYVLDLPLDLSCSATELDWQADLFAGARDDDLTSRVIRDWDSLPEPFFAVVHYSNIHVPRVYDPNNAPFQPVNDLDHPSPSNEGYKNYYKNVVYLSDLAVGRLLRFLRSTESGARTVVVYTSDHGESYREHGQQGEHAGTIFDEEIRVPAWVDAPPGVLLPSEEEGLRSVEREPTFHLDLAPTMLDLMGVWDDPSLARFRARMPGRTLLRKGQAAGPMPITTASWVWEGQRPVWGLMLGTKKIQARTFVAPAYDCYDLADDPGEQRPLSEADCDPLPALASAIYGGAPGSMPRRVELDPLR